MQQVEFLRARHGVQVVRDGLRRRTADADRDGLRIAHGPLHQAVDLRRNGGGKEQRLPVARALFQEPADIGQKPHVQQPIRLVEDDDFQVLQLECAAFEIIQRPSRRDDPHIHAGRQLLALLAVADAAVHHAHLQRAEAAERPERRLDLERQLACRLYDKSARAAEAVEPGQDGQGKCRGLAGAGLGRADDILAFEDQGNGAFLDRGGCGVTSGLYGQLHVRGKLEVFKNHVRSASWRNAGRRHKFLRETPCAHAGARRNLLQLWGFVTRAGAAGAGHVTFPCWLCDALAANNACPGTAQE